MKAISPIQEQIVVTDREKEGLNDLFLDGSVDSLLKKMIIEMKLRGFSRQTIKMYLFYNLNFIKFTAKNPYDVTIDDMKDYIVSKMDNNLSSGSVSSIVAALHFFYGEVLRKDVSKLKYPKVQHKLPEYLTKKEIQKLISASACIRDMIIIKLLYSTGLRLSESLNLRYSDIDFNDNIGWVRMGKGKKDRMFILSEKLKPDLLFWKEMNLSDNNDFVIARFCGVTMSGSNIQRIVKQTAKHANIKKNVHPHTLRHTFATHLLDNGTGILQISKLLGHVSLSTTERYVHVSDQQLKDIHNPLDIIYKNSSH